MSSFRVGLIVLAIIALTGVARSFEAWAPAIVVRMQATWQEACGRTFIRQRATVTNYTVSDLCFTKRVCGTDKLLSIKDDQGTPVAFGFSCGRSADGDRIEDPSSVFVEVGSHDDITFGFGGAAGIIIDLDAPDENLSRERRYRGQTEIGYARCADLKRNCPGELCRWSNVARIMTWERVADVDVSYAGKWCPKGFNPWGDNADPPLPKEH